MLTCWHWFRFGASPRTPRTQAEPGDKTLHFGCFREAFLGMVRSACGLLQYERQRLAGLWVGPSISDGGSPNPMFVRLKAGTMCSIIAVTCTYSFGSRSRGLRVLLCPSAVLPTEVRPQVVLLCAISASDGGNETRFQAFHAACVLMNHHLRHVVRSLFCLCRLGFCLLAVRRGRRSRSCPHMDRFDE